MIPKIVLILGNHNASALHIANAFYQRGFYVVVVAPVQDQRIAEAVHLYLVEDFQYPHLIRAVFQTVKERLGIPNVVIYNEMIYPIEYSPFDIPINHMSAAMTVNIGSPYIALQEAVQCFMTLPEGDVKVFIYTGYSNADMMNLAAVNIRMARVSMGEVIRTAVKWFEGTGYQFYIEVQRSQCGDVFPANVDGEMVVDEVQHAEFCYELASRKIQGCYEASFVVKEGGVDWERCIERSSLVPEYPMRAGWVPLSPTEMGGGGYLEYGDEFGRLQPPTGFTPLPSYSEAVKRKRGDGDDGDENPDRKRKNSEDVIAIEMEDEGMSEASAVDVFPDDVALKMEENYQPPPPPPATRETVKPGLEKMKLKTVLPSRSKASYIDNVVSEGQGGIYATPRASQACDGITYQRREDALLNAKPRASNRSSGDSTLDGSEGSGYSTKRSMSRQDSSCSSSSSVGF